MATSHPPLPQGTPFPVKFDTSINLDNVNENVYSFDDGTAPSLTNSGILRDDGVTNIYQTLSASSQDQVFYAPNGKQIALSYSAQSAYVDGVKVGGFGPYGESARSVAPYGAIDWALTASDTWLLLNRGVTASLTDAFSTTAAPGSGWTSVAYGNGVFVAVASTTSTTSGIARSTDNGLTWTFVTTTAPGGTGWWSVTYGNGVFVAVAFTTSTTAGIARSTDNGLTWTFVTTTAPGGTGWAFVTYGNGVFVAVASTTSTTAGIARSTDNGLTWAFVTTSAPASGWYSVSYGNGVFFAIATTTSTTAGIARSTDDGVTWTFVTTTAPGGTGWHSVGYGNGVFVAVAFTLSTTAGIARSTDNGLTWAFVTTSAPGGANGWASVTYGNGVWQVVAATTSTTAGIARSTDNGLTWAFVNTSAPANGWYAVTYGNGVFVSICSTFSTTAGIMVTSTSQALAYVVTEYNPTTKAILNTQTLTTSVTNLPNYACFVKSHQMTYANVNVAYTYFTGTTVFAGFFSAGVSKTAFNAAGKSYTFQGISAFSNGGTVIIGGICDNTTMPKSYSSPSPYTVWTGINETSFLANYEDFNTSASLTLNLIGTPSNLSTANLTTFGTKVSISTAGVVTTTAVTQAGLTIVPADMYSGFGFSSGRFKSTAATKFSPWILDNSGTPASITETVTDYSVKPQAVCSIGITTARKAFVYTLAGKPSQVVWGGVSGAMPICEYGNVNAQVPVTQWLNSLGVYSVAIPGTSTISVATIGANTYQMIPISKDVVQLTDSYGTIIDTSTGNVEVNSGAHCPAFVSDIYLTGTTLLAYQTQNKFSNAVDTGTELTATGLSLTVPMTRISIAGAIFLPVVFYQVSVSGTLKAKAIFAGTAQIATDTTVSYVTNTNLPPPVDALYSGGGVQLLSGSALQTVNFSDSDAFAQYYAGYTLANQLPVVYQFFNLFGQLYGFDGQKIYRVPVNGATVGNPEQVAIASGMTFIANSPTVAWFLSSFDNCLYVFTGGQKLEKWQEMTGVSAVSSGVWSTRENSLFLQLSDSTMLIFRDNHAGQLTNAYTLQTTYATDIGTYFVSTATPSFSALWSYAAGSGTPITLTWQSGFYGMGRNQYSRITQLILTLKVSDPVTTALTINYKWVTANSSGTETATYAANTYQVSSGGYVRLQYNPTQALVYGASIGVSCTKKVILYDAVLYYTDGGVAPVPNRLP